MSKNVVTLKSGLEVSQGHGRLYHPIRPHDFLLTFHSNHRPISHRFRDKRRSPSKIANFSHPRVFNAPAEGVPLGILYRRKASQKLLWWGYQMIDDKPARRVYRSVKVTKHSTIPYVRYSFLLCNCNFVFKTRPFYDIPLQVTLKSGSEVTHGHWKWHS